jgi:hypothetical protein
MGITILLHILEEGEWGHINRTTGVRSSVPGWCWLIVERLFLPFLCYHTYCIDSISNSSKIEVCRFTYWDISTTSPPALHFEKGDQGSNRKNEPH